MNITLNIPIAFLERFVQAVEQLARDYADVHKPELETLRNTTPVPNAGKTFYQSDKAVWEQEQKDKAERAELYGEDDG